MHGCATREIHADPMAPGGRGHGALSRHRDPAAIVCYPTDISARRSQFHLSGSYLMPARIVIVHDDPVFAQGLIEKLGADHVAWFTNPVQALKVLEQARTVEFLISRIQFANRQPLGLSLARVLRGVRPDVRVIFTGDESHRQYVRGWGEFVPEPVEAVFVGMIIEWLSEPIDESKLA
jgi:hypothetical protein